MIMTGSPVTLPYSNIENGIRSCTKWFNPCSPPPNMIQVPDHLPARHSIA